MRANSSWSPRWGANPLGMLWPEKLFIRLCNPYEAALEQGEFSKVGAILDQLIAQQEAQPVRQHKQLAQSYASRAGLAVLQFDYGTAWDYYRTALRYQPNDAVILNAAGGLLFEWGRYGAAEPLFRRALEIREKALDPDDPEVAESLNNLAALYLAQGRYGEAEPLFRRALDIREKASHPEVAESLSNLASLHLAQGRYDEAEPLFRRALEIREKALDPDDPKLGDSLSDLAELHRAQGRYGEAEWLLRRALAIMEKSLGRDNPSIAPKPQQPGHSLS